MFSKRSYAFDNVTAEQFAYLMQYVEAAHGAPRGPRVRTCFRLMRRFEPSQQRQIRRHGLHVAIGAMPDWIRR